MLEKSALEFRIIDHGTAAYDQLVDLRDRVLRKPLGLAFTEAQLAAEHDQVHIGGFIGDQVYCCLVIIIGEQDVKVRQVAVDAKVQGKGFGRMLNLFAEDYCVKMGKKRLYCHARKTAIKFYEGLGYEVYDEPFEEVGIPHRKMEKKI